MSLTSGPMRFALLMGCFLPAVLHAATIRVTTTAESAADGACALREALEAAQTHAAVDSCAAGTGSDIIRIPAGTYQLSSTLEVQARVTVEGVSAAETILRMAGTDRVLKVAAGATVVLRKLTVTGGVVHDEATQQASGGGVLNWGDLTVEDSVIDNNTADRGGAVYNLAGSLVLRRTTLSHNQALLVGGALENNGTLLMDSCTVSANSGAAGVAGIYNTGAGRIINSTLVGNTSTGDMPGGAIYSSAPLAVVSCTISGNASPDLALFSNGGPANIILKDSIVYGNPGRWDLSSVTSLGYNVVGVLGGDSMGSTTIIGEDPLLGALGDHGGPTWTQVPGEGSPALGFGDCTDELGQPTRVDQRGRPRPEVGCDVGAVQTGANPVLQRVVFVGAGDGHCPTGGTLVEEGEDSGVGGGIAGDGVLQDGEVQDSFYVCGAVNTQVRVVAEPAGAHCAAGGQRIEVGPDDNANGVLDSAEVDPSRTTYVCNGQDGAPGATGPAGATGANGKDGTDGANGAAGPTGPAGEKGADGADGADGGCSAAGSPSLWWLALALLWRRRR